jgi:predicted ATPase
MLALYRSGRQAEALEAYQQTRETLVEELGIDPSPDLRQLYRQILNQDETLAAPTADAEARADIPVPPTPLVGRERELKELEQLVARDDVRLLTLTGPGGVGKTRLVLALARSEAAETPRPVVFVDLSATNDLLLALSTIARALGLEEESGESPLEAIVRHLGGRRLLLVLDNLEQLSDFAPAAARMLSAAEGLKLVATSRVRLGLQAEYEVVIPPLGLPSPGEREARAIGESEAVVFFCTRAQAAQASFSLTDENAPAVASLCASLDGLPLALELAAARIKLFSAEALQARLSQGLAGL